MKKIFRMALVFTLAGATLMYTGCTKDYQEDINNLDSKITNLQNDLTNKLNDLSGQVSTLSGTVNSLQSAVSTLQSEFPGVKSDVATLKNKVENLEGAVADLKANYATKQNLADEVSKLEAKIAEVKDLILNEATGVQKQLNDLKATVDENTKAIEEAQALLDEVFAALSGLSSIVFIPDFYYGGIEATSYDFANIAPYDRVKAAVETTDDQGAAVKFPATSTTSFKAADEKKAFTLGQIGIANYDINPSTFPLDSAEWALHGMDRKYVAVKADEKVWAPVFKGIAYKEAKNGVPYAAVNYTIENPELLKYEDNVPVMQLEATLDDGKVVSSDWEAVVSGDESIAHLAFAKSNLYVTKEDPQCALSANTNKDLYLLAKTTAENVHSIEVQYNGGPVALDTLIAAHVNNTMTGLLEYSLDSLNTKYPGFTFNFELVPYTSGNNTTSEDMYGKIDGVNFIPCWVSSEGGQPVSNPIEKGSEDGISSVGRTPIVLVTLVNKEQIAAYGYFKIKIVKEAVEPTTRVLGPLDLGKVPFICDPVTKGLTWFDFSHFVLENLKMDYEDFTKTYSYDQASAYELDKDGKFVAVGEKYGKVVYNKDSEGSTINDIFEWTIDPQKIGEGKTVTIYVRFKNNATELDQVFFALSATVAEAASFDFGANKINNEWFDDIDNEYKNTARVNVPVPTADQEGPGGIIGGDVTVFTRDLNHYYIGYVPAVTLTEDADEVYAPYFDGKADPEDIVTNSYYYFSDEQPVINGFQFFTDETNTKLYVAAEFDKDGKLVATEADKDGNYKIAEDDANLIAYLTVEKTDDGVAPADDDESGATGADDADTEDDTDDEEVEKSQNNIIQYSWEEGNTIAKYFLNLWSYKTEDQAEMLYANILVKTTYDKCGIDAGLEEFHVRFIRPLDIDLKGQDIAEESAVDGANVEIAKFLNGITDWNNQKVVIPEVVDGEETGYYVANVIKTVDMYAYYQFTTLEVDLNKAIRNNWNTQSDDPENDWDVITKVTPAVKLALGTVDEEGVFTAIDPDEEGVYKLDIKDITKLQGYVINYRNDSAYVEGFTIKVPVEINYAWGTYVAEFVINIKETGETEPKKPAK